MDLNKFSTWEDIWKLKFNIENVKYYILDSKNIKVEQKLSHMKIINVNEICEQEVGFDDTIIFWLLYGGRMKWLTG